MTQADFYTLFPVIFLTAWASLLLLADLFIPKARKGITAILAAVGFAAALGIVVEQIGQTGVGFSGMVTLDAFSTFVNALLLLTGLLGISIAYDYLRRMGIERGEYYALLLFSVAGMMLMAQATDLIVIFLALELLSIPLYVMAAFARPRVESEEAGIKYFLLGAFAAAFLLYGIALVFGATQATSFEGIAAALAGGTANLPLLTVAAALVLVGFAFKVAAVPFHMWTPDVYHGAPTSVTAFMAAGAKIAGFAALLRVFTTVFSSVAASLTPIFWVLAALTMIVGNLIAVSQTNIKRMLAYSSIAHAGYILMAFVTYENPKVAPVAVASALFYLASYLLTNFGSWGVVVALEKEEGRGLEIADFAGLGRRRPALAAAMTVFMLSLAGVPPTLGLVGKFYLFRAVIAGGYFWLAIIGVLTSLISAYYYLRVVVVMYMREGEPRPVSESWLNLTWGAMAVLTVLLSFVPAPLFDWASRAVMRLF